MGAQTVDSGDLWERSMARADGCPECLNRDNLPLQVRVVDEGFLALYYCHNRDCLHNWTTWWRHEPEREDGWP